LFLDGLIHIKIMKKPTLSAEDLKENEAPCDEPFNKFKFGSIVRNKIEVTDKTNS